MLSVPGSLAANEVSGAPPPATPRLGRFVREYCERHPPPLRSTLLHVIGTSHFLHRQACPGGLGDGSSYDRVSRAAVTASLRVFRYWRSLAQRRPRASLRRLRVFLLQLRVHRFGIVYTAPMRHRACPARCGGT